VLVEVNRREKYIVNMFSYEECEKNQFKKFIQYAIDTAWNQFIYSTPLLNNVVKLDPADSWNIDYTLSVIAVPLLKQLKKTNHGYFQVDDCDLPDDFNKVSADCRCDDDEIIELERYNYIMDEIIWCLNEISNHEENSPDIDSKHLANSASADNNNKETEQWLKDCWAYDKRIQRGCALFGKYFRNLWD